MVVVVVVVLAFATVVDFFGTHPPASPSSVFLVEQVVFYTIGFANLVSVVGLYFAKAGLCKGKALGEPAATMAGQLSS